ncbi:ABC transporter ATP-binding protein [Streptomyces marispadix]|uniref:ABC transporter ATP-binding protein/permease n=1 Tax=Streptomyces marispadix TaxID=2922868 RepID=A0ABS9T388_9ACTN|nr:ABC transporter ATP-binding protein [Streptomyces marispadix]MCH6162726.1 ABC transporter ATP-binding protein/permease [Streptomyces marispadix]
MPGQSGRPDPARLPDGADPFDGDVLPAPPHAARTLLASLLRPHRARVAATALLLLLQQAAVQAGPLLVAFAIDQAVPALRGGGGQAPDQGPLIAVGLAYLVCATASGGLQYAFIVAAARVNQRVLLDLRGRIYRHAQALDVDFHDRYTSGRLISRSTTDVASLRELLDEGLQELLAVIVSVVYIVITLLWLDPGLGAAALASFVPLALLVRGFQRRSKRVYRGKSTAMAAVIVKFTETVGGIRAVQAFRRERANDGAFARLNGRHWKMNGDSLLEMARYVVNSRVTANSAVAAIVLWGAYRVADGDLALGVLAAAALYLRRLYEPIDHLGMFLNSYQSAAASLEKIAGLLAQRPSVPEPSAPGGLPPRRERQPGREVVFDAVSFGYRTGGEVLPSFQLTLHAGQTVALVGATGAGKSTLVKLLARFYDPTSGRVLLDGVDLRDLAGPELRRNVVMVTQEAFLFSGTVAENIAIGRPDATREQIEGAAKALGAHEFIAALPEGYDTDVRKRGGRISAGQRQLVAFARALLADPAVLILDEATSSLDIPGEQAVQQAMSTVLRDRTAVVIAHRLSTVEIADRVLVMDHGRLVEDGTPAQLTAGEGRFADLHSAWRESLA